MIGIVSNSKNVILEHEKAHACEIVHTQETLKSNKYPIYIYLNPKPNFDEPNGFTTSLTLKNLKDSNETKYLAKIAKAGKLAECNYVNKHYGLVFSLIYKKYRLVIDLDSKKFSVNFWTVKSSPLI